MTSREYNEVITEEYILRRAAVVVARKSRHSIIANAEAENALPQFQLRGAKWHIHTTRVPVFLFLSLSNTHLSLCLLYMDSMGGDRD